MHNPDFCILSLFNILNIIMKTVKLITISVLAFMPLLATADGGITALGYADRDSLKGIELEVGYRKTFGNIGVNILPLTGIFHDKSNSKYYKDTTSSGTSVCRNSSNGHSTNINYCRNGFSYAFMASADYAISQVVTAGAGVRLSDKIDPYVTLDVLISKGISLQAKAGGKYTSAGLSLSF
jgi:hypothetical protein